MSSRDENITTFYENEQVDQSHEQNVSDSPTNSVSEVESNQRSVIERDSSHLIMQYSEQVEEENESMNGEMTTKDEKDNLNEDALEETFLSLRDNFPPPPPDVPRILIYSPVNEIIHSGENKDRETITEYFEIPDNLTNITNVERKDENGNVENVSTASSREGNYDLENNELRGTFIEIQNRSNEFEPLAMDEVSLDSFYAPPVPRTYDDIDDEIAEQEKTNQIKSKEGFRVIWKNLIYKVNMYSLFNHMMNVAFDTVPKSYKRTILKGISGSFESGKMTALMGPSGAGKTTLLECLIGKRVKGLSGEIKVEPLNRSDKIPKIDLAIIPQLDSFFENITPREAILYSSKLKNCHGSFRHDEIVQELIDRLELNSCSELETVRLSGSQRKRLSIACDLVSKPNFLVLDEPTTGLDAYAARTLCELLNELAVERNLAILMTVHQPSWAIFLTFHKIYMLSPVVGRAIYEGTPEKLVDHLAAFDLHCPVSTNASDYLTEVAFGHAKKQQLLDLADYQKDQFEKMDRSSKNSVNLFDHLQENSKSYPIFKHALILTSRFTLTFVRDLFNLLVTLTISSFLAVIFCVAFTFSGESDGCPPDVSMVPMMNNSYYNKLLVDTSIESKEVSKNMAMTLFLEVIAIMLTLTPALVLIPQELKIYRKEVKNSYYSPSILYLAKCIFEFTLNLLFVAYFETIIYFGTKQRFISSKNGFSGFIGVFEGLYMLSLITQAQGTIIAVALAASPDSVIIGGNLLVMVNMIFQALFNSFYERHWFTQAVGFFVPARWMAPITIIALYGHERCWNYPVEKNLNLIKEKIETWVALTSRVVDKNLQSPIVPPNFWLSQDIEQIYYSNNNLTYTQYREISKQYTDLEGNYLPMAMIKLGVNEDDDLQSHLMLLFHLLFFRIIANLAIVRATKKTE